MTSTYFLGAILLWTLLLSGYSVMSEGLVSYSQNISVSSRYHSNFTEETLPPRSSHDQTLALGPNVVTHWANIQSYGEFHGLLASLSVYGVPVGPNQLSEAVVSFSVANDGPRELMEAMQFGWHVWPAHYGDNDTHFFIHWTKDGFQNTGCYNLDCEGFVFDKRSQYRPGNKLKPLSERDGKQYYITARIALQPDGNWWLYYGSEWEKPIGYWPLLFFNRLWYYATRIDVGGRVQFRSGQPSPPMGSGLRPSDPNGKAAMVRVQYQDAHLIMIPVRGSIHVDRGDCYSLARSDGDFYYGGPGGCTD